MKPHAHIIHAQLPLAYEYETLADVPGARTEEILAGIIELDTAGCEHPQHPSILAADMIARCVVLSATRRSRHDWPDEAAFIEASDVLGAYIRRLEDTARAYGAHIRDAHPPTTPGAGHAPPSCGNPNRITWRDRWRRRLRALVAQARFRATTTR